MLDNWSILWLNKTDKLSLTGVTLSGENSTVEWDVLSNDEDYPRGQKLIIKQILLGAEAKNDEFNVVEVINI